MLQNDEKIGLLLAVYIWGYSIPITMISQHSYIKKGYYLTYVLSLKQWETLQKVVCEQLMLLKVW